MVNLTECIIKIKINETLLLHSESITHDLLNATGKKHPRPTI